MVSEPLTLTFIVANQTVNENKLNKESYQTIARTHVSELRDPDKILREHENFCIFTAFLYFITIMSFVYLMVTWIKLKMLSRMEIMPW